MHPLALYIHWPFCKAKCPYCDFNSHVRESVDHAAWRDALLRELEWTAARVPGRQLTSIFFGGGTPSLMQAQTAGALIERATMLWPVAEDLEITLEANPTSVEAGKFREFRAAGVNRVSLGVQALTPADLSFLGRQHNAQEALKAVELADSLFPRYSFDLIYARPGQSLAAWECELRQALGFARGHLSLYQLTIEENTAFHHAYAKGQFQLPEEELAAQMFELTQAVMDEAGLPAYEVSNHAAPGQESRHNLAYWRGDEYAGIGPGAHGRLHLSSPPVRGEVGWGGVRHATETQKSPERWLEQVRTHGHGLIAQSPLTAREHLEEALMMGLRLKEGIDLADFERKTARALHEALSRERITALIEQGMLEETATALRATAQGWLLLSSVTKALLAANSVAV